MKQKDPERGNYLPTDISPAAVIFIIIIMHVTMIASTDTSMYN